MKTLSFILVRVALTAFGLGVMGATVEAATGPALSAASTVSFGAVALGSSSSKDLKIKNAGRSDLTVGTPTLSDGEFAITGNSCATVSPGTTCSLTVTYTPAAYAAKTKTAILTIPSDDPKSPKTVNLKASCPPPKIAGVSKSVNFGTKNTGSTSARKFTIRNGGISPLAISAFAVTNDDSDHQDFSLSDETTCNGASLAKNGTCVVWLYFKPSGTGTRTGSLTFNYNDSTGTQTASVALKGTAKGSAPVISSFSASPPAVVAGDSTILSWSVANAASLSIDQGVGTVTGTSISVTPPGTGKITYTLSAVNSSGTSTAKTAVTVSSTGNAEIDPTPFAVSVGDSVGSYDATDVVSNTTFKYTVIIDFTANTARLSTDSDGQIIGSGGVTLTTEDGNITIAKTTYGITITSPLSSQAVSYRLTGTLGGTLTVASDGVFKLLLEGVTINGGTSGPALYLSKATKAFIVTSSATTNTLTDQSTRSGLTTKAALYGTGPMIFSGDGTLSVTGNYKHAIFGKDYVRMRGGTLDVAVTAKNAIHTINKFVFDDGKLTINATGATEGDESKAIKVEGEESAAGAGKGYIVLNGGYITITSVGKAITAGWDIDEDAQTSDTSDDPDPYVEINHGVVMITTTGASYEYYRNGEKISCSPEGIEGKSRLTVNSGYLDIHTTDDALNAGNSITINDGHIYAFSTTNDAIDSNGTMTINGGVIVAIGAAIPEAAFDCDQNTFTITGGTFVGIAGTTSNPTASACKQNTIILGSRTAGTTMALRSSSGAVAFAFTIPQSYTTMLLSSPDIATGTKYTIYTGGTALADYAFNGLYLDNMSYSGGSAGTGFTVSSCVTNLGR